MICKFGDKNPLCGQVKHPDYGKQCPLELDDRWVVCKNSKSYPNIVSRDKCECTTLSSNGYEDHCCVDCICSDNREEMEIYILQEVLKEAIQ